MKKRSFLIPVLSAFTFGATAGCAPAIVGEWSLEAIDDQDMPYTLYYGAKCQIEVGITLTIETDLTGKFKWDAQGECFGTEATGFDLDLEVTEEGSSSDKSYEIEVDGRDAQGTEIEFEFECTMPDSDSLECEDEIEANWLFERK